MLRQWQQRVLDKEPTGSAFGGSQILPLFRVIERDSPLVAYKLNYKLSQFKLVTATNTKYKTNTDAHCTCRSALPGPVGQALRLLLLLLLLHNVCGTTTSLVMMSLAGHIGDAVAALVALLGGCFQP